MFYLLPGLNFEFLDSSQDDVMGRVGSLMFLILSLTVQNFGLQIQAACAHLHTDLSGPKDIPAAVLLALRRRDPGSSPYGPRKCIRSHFRRISGVKDYWGSTHPQALGGKMSLALSPSPCIHLTPWEGHGWLTARTESPKVRVPLTQV